MRGISVKRMRLTMHAHSRSDAGYTAKLPMQRPRGTFKSGSSDTRPSNSAFA